ncbi:DUF808 family protein, partial [Wenzhouxiangella sp. 15181]
MATFQRPSGDIFSSRKFVGILEPIPWAIVPLLMLGGAFLCYEGA